MSKRVVDAPVGPTANDNANRATGRRRTKNPRGEGERLRFDILDAATQLLGQLESESALSLRSVAREVGISTPSIYNHFTDKQEMLLAVITRQHEELAAFMAASQVASDPPKARLKRQVRAYCTYSVDNPSHFRLLFGLRHSVATPSVLPHTPSRHIVELFTSIIEDCVAAGDEVRLPARRAAVMLFVGLHGRVAIWHTNPGRTHVEDVYEFADELVDLLVVETKPLNKRGTRRRA